MRGCHRSRHTYHIAAGGGAGLRPRPGSAARARVCGRVSGLWRGGADAATPAAGLLSAAPVERATSIATFVAGCLRAVETRVAAVLGVVDAVVGYTGGTTAYSTYEQVRSDLTGHAEAVRLQFDRDAVAYQCLVEVFFALHDPTTGDRQGWDVGSQYRPAIFFHTPQQESVARTVGLRLTQSGAFDDPIARDVVRTYEDPDLLGTRNEICSAGAELYVGYVFADQRPAHRPTLLHQLGGAAPRSGGGSGARGLRALRSPVRR